MTRPQNSPKTSRPRISTSKDWQALETNIKQAAATERQFTIRMELRLQGESHLDTRSQRHRSEGFLSHLP